MIVNDQILIWIAIGSGVLALLFAWMKATWIGKQDAGTDRMKEIAKAIAEGAMAFLTREYKVLLIFVVAVGVLLGLANLGKEDSSPLLALSFVVGAFCSALAGFFGMRVATKANVRTANAARTGLPEALQIAFSGGSVMGLCVVGLGIIGLSVLFLFYGQLFNVNNAELMQADSHQWHLNVTRLLNVISGFSLGASSIALFARVGGGIYTKAADVGADLVGKVEAGIPEDDPRNPAVIADNVGDNVGDVAGMGADLFESYVGSIVGTMILGASIVAATPDYNGLAPVILPLVLAGVGIIASVIGTFFVKTKEGGNPQNALNIGSFGAAALMLIGSYFVIQMLWPTG
ncbi:MAG: sodium/proton-translocating pyrophosphatase, partial [Bacteroidetes bacterium]|nr:sodium/proton-translocating pyrophosphatase [Bacteroidota bacterium]